VTEGCSLRGYAAIGIAGCFRSIDSFVSGRSPCSLSSALPPSRRVTKPVIVRGFIATPINTGKTAIRHAINTGAASFLVLFARKRSCPDSANLSRIHREEFYGNLANSCWGKGAQDAIKGKPDDAGVLVSERHASYRLVDEEERRPVIVNNRSATGSSCDSILASLISRHLLNLWRTFFAAGCGLSCYVKHAHSYIRLAFVRVYTCTCVLQTSGGRLFLRPTGTLHPGLERDVHESAAVPRPRSDRHAAASRTADRLRIRADDASGVQRTSARAQTADTSPPGHRERCAGPQRR